MRTQTSSHGAGVWRILWLLALLVPGAACSTTRRSPPPPPPQGVAVASPAARSPEPMTSNLLPYRISPGDELMVSFYNRPPGPTVGDYRVNCDDELSIRVADHSEYNLDARVRPDGRISFYSSGDLEVRGKTVPEISQLLTEALNASIPTAQVFVSLTRGHALADDFLHTLMGDKRQGTSRQYLVTREGLIALPLIGEVPVVGLSLPELTSTLDKQYGLLFVDSLAISVNLVSGQKGTVVVLGEVRSPGVYKVMDPVHPIYLLAMAGGPRETANISKAILVHPRPDGTHEQVDAQLDLRSGDGSAVHTVIGPGDMLLVPKTAIANVNVFVQQYIRGLIPASLSVGATHEIDNLDLDID